MSSSYGDRKSDAVLGQFLARGAPRFSSGPAIPASLTPTATVVKQDTPFAQQPDLLPFKHAGVPAQFKKENLGKQKRTELNTFDM